MIYRTCGYYDVENNVSTDPRRAPILARVVVGCRRVARRFAGQRLPADEEQSVEAVAGPLESGRIQPACIIHFRGAWT